MFEKAIAIAALLFAFGVQGAPQPDIYLARLTIGGTSVSVGPAENITNSPGYDNQPFFLPDNRGLLFASNRDGKQNDIYRYDVAAKKIVQLTHTDENEYSPTPTPDGKSFSVVHGAEQSLWRFDLDGANGKLAYQHAGLIGYHAWASPTSLALFILGAQQQPATLQFVDLSTGKAEVVDTGIGRSILNRRDNTISYVVRQPDNSWTVKQFDPKTRAVAEIVKNAGEFGAWLPDGAFVIGRGTKLLMWRPGDAAFAEIADLAGAKLSGISRLAVSRDGRWLAIVASPTP